MIKQTAEERGQEMMCISMNKIPPLAYKFAQKVVGEIGCCGKVMLTCWIVYAQCVEGLKCKDPLYKASKEDKKWFKENSEENKL